jgi:hypothetical protein
VLDLVKLSEDGDEDDTIEGVSYEDMTPAQGRRSEHALRGKSPRSRWRSLPVRARRTAR